MHFKTNRRRIGIHDIFSSLYSQLKVITTFYFTVIIFFTAVTHPELTCNAINKQSAKPSITLHYFSFREYYLLTTVSNGFSLFSLLGKLKDDTVPKDLTRSTTKNLSDYVFYCLSHFVYLPAVKNRVQCRV